MLRAKWMIEGKEEERFAYPVAPTNHPFISLAQSFAIVSVRVGKP